MSYKSLLTFFLLAVFSFPIYARQSTKSSKVKTDKITIYRDEYGVPHIYAPTHEAGLYASGWAQAEDRLEEILKNYLRDTGEMASDLTL